ncbi:PKD domain-containing protein [Myxococcota bacterium]|nr:PKD domain-containing protein [Myxococcota bacterium]
MDLEVLLNLQAPPSTLLVVEALNGPDVVYQDNYISPEVGGAFEQMIYIPEFMLQDAASVTLLVRVTPEGGAAVQDSVTFRLDRAFPVVTFDEASLMALYSCTDNPVNLNYQVDDAQDPNPTVEEDARLDECQRDQIIRVADDCGNAQEMVFSTTTPAAEAITTAILVFACDVNGCDAPLEEGGATGVAQVDFQINARNCAMNQGADYRYNNGEGWTEWDFLFHNQLFEEAGDYEVRVFAEDCAGARVEEQASFSVVAEPVADAGGPFSVQQGVELILDASPSFASPTAGGIVEYAWDINNDSFFDVIGADEVTLPYDTDIPNGTYYVTLRITAGNGQTASTLIEITITDVTPTCQLGGPYEIEEGVSLILSAAGTAAGSLVEPIVTFEWDFGDGLSAAGATLEAPSHVYADAGSYTVNLRVNDADSFCEVTTTVTVTEVDPIIDVVGIGIAAPAAPIEGEAVRFTIGQTAPGSTSDPLTRFAWDFGDGATAEGQAPTHTYPDNGVYNVCLTVEDEDSQSQHCFNVEIGDIAPIAHFDGPDNAVDGQEVTFEATLTRAGGDADQLTELTWDFGDGTDPVTVPADQRQITHAFSGEGDVAEFTITLTVHDEDSTDTFQHVIRVLDVVPTAGWIAVYPGEQEQIEEGVDLVLDASTSAPGHEMDPIVTYIWDMGDDTGFHETEEPVYAYGWQDNGTYQVTLTVLDVDGSQDSQTHLIEVTNRAPTVRIEMDPSDPEINQEVIFRAIVDDVAGDLPPAQITWDMGDDTELTGETEVRHTYTAATRFNVFVTVVDKDGADADSFVSFDVTGSKPQIEYAGDIIEGREGEPLSFRVEIRSGVREINNGVTTYDGPVSVNVYPPSGFECEVSAGANEVALKYVDCAFEPTYFDAGDYDLRISADSPLTNLGRSRDFIVRIVEGGSPVLAAVSTNASGLSRLTSFAYERDGDMRLRPVAEVNLGFGAGGLIIGPNNRYAFIGVPGSAGVAVVTLAGTPQLQRVIPTGLGVQGLALGDGVIWAINAGEGSVSMIDPVTLKVIRTTAVAQVVGALDVAWLSADFTGLSEARLAISTASGRLLLLDPVAIEDGGDAIVSDVEIGGVLSEIEGDPAGGKLYTADVKTRTIYEISARDLEENPAFAAPVPYPSAFMPTDLLFVEGTLWIASEEGLGQLSNGLIEVDGLTRVKTLGPLTSGIFSDGLMVLFDGQQVINYSRGGQGLLSASATRVRSLAAFVALE